MICQELLKNTIICFNLTRHINLILYKRSKMQRMAVSSSIDSLLFTLKYVHLINNIS